MPHPYTGGVCKRNSTHADLCDLRPGARCCWAAPSGIRLARRHAAFRRLLARGHARGCHGTAEWGPGGGMRMRGLQATEIEANTKIRTPMRSREHEQRGLWTAWWLPFARSLQVTRAYAPLVSSTHPRTHPVRARLLITVTFAAEQDVHRHVRSPPVAESPLLPPGYGHCTTPIPHHNPLS